LPQWLGEAAAVFFPALHSGRQRLPLPAGDARGLPL